MASTKNIKYTIGGPEVTVGTAVAREYVIPIRALPGLDKTVERAADPAIIGRNMLAGEYTMVDSVQGNIPLSPRACGGFGQILSSLLGTPETPVEIGACIRIRYTGASASCKITAETSGDTLSAAIGTAGAEIADTNFGDGGTFDLSAAAYNTVGEIVNEIGYCTNYECEKVFGDDDIAATDIVSMERQANDKWAYFYFSNSATSVYLHRWEVDLTDTERPTYTIQADGFETEFLRPGCVVDQLTLSAALKGIVEGEATIEGMSETDEAGASALSLEDIDPLIFYKGNLSFGANEYIYIRNINLTLGNSHNPDAGYGFGSAGRQAHQKSEFVVSGSLQLRLDSTSYAERAKLTSGTQIALALYFYGSDIATDLPQCLLIEIPYCVISNVTFTDNSGVIDLSIEFKGLYPKGTVYDPALSVAMLTEDSSAY